MVRDLAVVSRAAVLLLGGAWVAVAACALHPPEPTAPAARLEAADAGARLHGPRLAAPPFAAPAAEEESEHAGEPVAVVPRRQPGGVAGPAAAKPVFFGLLHAHTLVSDGSGAPQAAYARAKQRGLDFMAVTPHNHASAEAGADDRRDGVLIATTPALYDSSTPVTVTRHPPGAPAQTVTLKSVKSAAASESGAQFVALFGQEFSTISSGNHANVIGEPSVITIPNGDYRPLYEGLAAGGTPRVVQINHPGVHDDLFYAGSSEKMRKHMFNDYGFDEYDEDFASLVDAADPHLVLIELLSGPAMIEEPQPQHHYSAERVHEEDYYYYLIQGFHLSPSAGHDNHYETWGDATPARMGVYAESLSANALLAAMRANRTFASEDSDLRVELRCGSTGMGGVLSLAEGAPLALELEVADPTEPDQQYEASLFYGDVQPQDRSHLHEWQPADGLVHSVSFHGDGTVSLDGFEASGLPEFFYVRVQQADGDRAWTAPVWINHPRRYSVD